MAPESESRKARYWIGGREVSSEEWHEGFNLARTPKPNEPTLTCSEVVERLATECVSETARAYCGNLAFSRSMAEKILHSWRERRVQELEEAIRSYLAYHQSMIDLGGAKEPFDKQMLEVLAHMQIEVVDKCKAALANSEWREQIRKGANHD